MSGIPRYVWGPNVKVEHAGGQGALGHASGSVRTPLISTDSRYDNTSPVDNHTNINIKTDPGATPSVGPTEHSEARIKAEPHTDSEVAALIASNDRPRTQPRMVVKEKLPSRVKDEPHLSVKAEPPTPPRHEPQLAIKSEPCTPADARLPVPLKTESSTAFKVEQRIATKSEFS
jgi:hypothetical protein